MNFEWYMKTVFSAMSNLNKILLDNSCCLRVASKATTNSMYFYKQNHKEVIIVIVINLLECFK